MRTPIIIMASILLLAACKKEEDCPATTPAPEPASYPTAEFAPFTPGSWWVYTGVNIDPMSGVETPNSIRDSIYVQQDSVIAGHTYAWLRGERFGSLAFSRFVRVDGPRLVSENGTRWMDVTAVSDTILVSPGGGPIDSIATVLAAQDLDLNTPIGLLNSEHVRDLVFYMQPGYISPLHEREHYVRHIGIGAYTSYYAGSGISVEMRLTSFHLEQ
jgi:hypothetical protein